ncbi:MAG: GNAT family N-acetyltransferase [Dongiaceae bacterium]
MADADPLTLRLEGDISTIPAAAWDACAGSANPFVSHAFLGALEASGSVGGRSGWRPCHAVLEDRAGRLRAAVPLYLKRHSYGEYVFDHGWASAFERAGGRYYPKLQGAVPFTPVPGPRLLVAPGPEREAIRRALVRGLVELAEGQPVSSLHVTFPDAEDAAALEEGGMMLRTGLQYHWTNQGYGSFEDFLAALSSRKRKAVRKERRQVAESGVALSVLTGAAIEPRHWDAFFDFYISTSDRKWGSPYLTREFFDELGARMPDRVALVVAERNGRLVAGALNLIGADALYGRNWGCAGDFRFLHFEACYYQAIEFAIARGLARVEAGAQGEHKIQRGYLPVTTYSAHWIRDPGFAAAVGDFLTRERAAIEQERVALLEMSPFRQENG